MRNTSVLLALLIISMFSPPIRCQKKAKGNEMFSNVTGELKAFEGQPKPQFCGHEGNKMKETA